MLITKKIHTEWLLGFRGELDSGWDWDTGIVNSKATMEDTTANRIRSSL